MGIAITGCKLVFLVPDVLIRSLILVVNLANGRVLNAHLGFLHAFLSKCKFCLFQYTLRTSQEDSMLAGY